MPSDKEWQNLDGTTYASFMWSAYPKDAHQCKNKKEIVW